MVESEQLSREQIVAKYKAQHGQVVVFAKGDDLLICRKANEIEAQKYLDKISSTAAKTAARDELVRTTRVYPETPAEADRIFQRWTFAKVPLANAIAEMCGFDDSLVQIEGN